jgi:GMP synthase-like glutamine amidotransferase
MFAALFERHAPDLRLQLFDVCNNEFPASTDACDAYLATGSRFSAYDDVGWIHSLKDFVRQLRDADRPFVGICFGHQVLAEALGGKVVKAEQGWGAGVHTIEIARHDAWMNPERRECGLQFMHQDQVVRLPENSVALGASNHCPVAMFRVGERMLGIQAHPEFTKDYSQALILNRVERIGEAKARAALSSLSRATDEALAAKWIAEFLTQSK